MSDSAQGPGWWLASDGRWYPPELWTGPPQAGPQVSQTGPQVSQAPGTAPYGYGLTGQPNPKADGSPAPYSPYSPYPPHAQPPQRTSINGLAVASLICSCAGIIALGIPSILGIVFGFIARARIRQSYGTQRGSGLALAGIIVGFVVVGLVVLGLVVDATHVQTGQ